MSPSVSPCTRIAALVILFAALFARPASAQQRWRLVEDLRIGGADTGAASFNEIRALAVDGTGQIYVLDQQAQEIRVFDRRGQFVRLVGRNGEGPGEFKRPNGMLIAPDGQLWVNDVALARLVVFDPRGKPTAHLRLPDWGFAGRWEAAFDPQGRLLEIIPSRGGVVRRYSPTTTRIDSLALPPCLPMPGDPTRWMWSYRTARGGGSFTVPFAPLTVRQLDGADGLWCGSGADYHLMAVELGTGAIRFDQSRKEAPAPIPAAIRDSALEALRQAAVRAPPGTIDETQVPLTFPTVQALDIDDERRLWAWVRRPGKLEIDLWSKTGTHLATMAAPPIPDIGRIVVVRSGKLYTVQRDADGVPFVVRYALLKR